MKLFFSHVAPFFFFVFFSFFPFLSRPSQGWLDVSWPQLRSHQGMLVGDTMRLAISQLLRGPTTSCQSKDIWKADPIYRSEVKLKPPAIIILVPLTHLVRVGQAKSI
ncbi:hypothetical protein BGZ63DRAFT_398120 [Mariannaea sp. PMI_226]|nr:hypothetical protein BGZ63DRAFT_398120 [Mariannaea sp. PMI_226]